MAVPRETRARSKKPSSASRGDGTNGRGAVATTRDPAELGLDNDRLIELFRMMTLIRHFEEKCAEGYAYGKIGGFLHLYIGEEAVAVGSIGALRADDHIVTHYRDHGYALAKGCDPGAVLAELYGRATGVSGGRGGSMHLADVNRHFWGGYAIVAGHIPLAVGIAHAIKYRGDDQVVVCYFGDGSTTNGYFHEALNIAAVWRLPIIFLAENNLYGMGTAITTASLVSDLTEKAAAYHIPAVQVDGMDVLAVYEATKRIAARCRAGEGPYFLEARTFRLRGHSMADADTYRSKDEIERWRGRDPILEFGHFLAEQRILSLEDQQRLDKEVLEEVEAAGRFADESPEPEPETLFEMIYAKPVGPDAG